MGLLDELTVLDVVYENVSGIDSGNVSGQITEGFGTPCPNPRTQRRVTL
jgi:hypothetical protein